MCKLGLEFELLWQLCWVLLFSVVALFLVLGTHGRKFSEVAYYATCPCHKSYRLDNKGMEKERKCKKEITVGEGQSEELVIRMMAWWLSSGVSSALIVHLHRLPYWLFLFDWNCCSVFTWNCYTASTFLYEQSVSTCLILVSLAFGNSGTSENYIGFDTGLDMWCWHMSPLPMRLWPVWLSDSDCHFVSCCHGLNPYAWPGTRLQVSAPPRWERWGFSPPPCLNGVQLSCVVYSLKRSIDTIDHWSIENAIKWGKGRSVSFWWTKIGHAFGSVMNSWLLDLTWPSLQAPPRTSDTLLSLEEYKAEISHYMLHWEAPWLLAVWRACGARRHHCLLPITVAGS